MRSTFLNFKYTLLLTLVTICEHVHLVLLKLYAHLFVTPFLPFLKPLATGITLLDSMNLTILDP